MKSRLIEASIEYLIEVTEHRGLYFCKPSPSTVLNRLTLEASEEALNQLYPTKMMECVDTTDGYHIFEEKK